MPIFDRESRDLEEKGEIKNALWTACISPFQNLLHIEERYEAFAQRLLSAFRTMIDESSPKRYHKSMLCIFEEMIRNKPTQPVKRAQEACFSETQVILESYLDTKDSANFEPNKHNLKLFVEAFINLYRNKLISGDELETILKDEFIPNFDWNQSKFVEEFSLIFISELENLPAEERDLIIRSYIELPQIKPHFTLETLDEVQIDLLCEAYIERYANSTQDNDPRLTSIVVRFINKICPTDEIENGDSIWDHINYQLLLQIVKTITLKERSFESNQLNQLDLGTKVIDQFLDKLDKKLEEIIPQYDEGGLSSIGFNIITSLRGELHYYKSNIDQIDPEMMALKIQLNLQDTLPPHQLINLIYCSPTSKTIHFS